MRKVVICGGHFSPALAIIEKLLQNKENSIFYLGRKHALEGDRSLSLEYKTTVGKLHLPFYSLTAGRLQRSLTSFTIFSLLKFPLGIIQSFLILLKIRPHIIVSFGGYVALPVCLAAFLLKIPIITHEQTQILGLTNRIISWFAKVLCLSFSDTKNIPSRVKMVVTGNPLRESILKYDNKEIVDFGDKRLPLIYITGGSLGSRSVNMVVSKIINELTSCYRIVHQCGNAREGIDYKYLLTIKDKLPGRNKLNYRLIKQIDPSLVGSVIRNASLVVGRAGANTILEIMACGTPAILIPLPWAANNEQAENAIYLKKLGIAEIIQQQQLSSEGLLNLIHTCFKNLEKYRNNTQQAKKIRENDAADDICRLIKLYS